MAAYPDKGEEYETTQFYGLAANPHGIFALYSYRSAQQFKKFWAAGSGRDYALGAMQAVYDRYDKVEDIIKAGLNASAEFDSGSSAPFDIYKVKLQDQPAPRVKGGRKTKANQR